VPGVRRLLLPIVRDLAGVGDVLPGLRRGAAGVGHRAARPAVRPSLTGRDEESEFMHNPGATFRDLLRSEPYLFTGGVYSPLDAQIAERVGMKSIYLSGYSMALANGWPDMGFLTQTEVARNGAMVAGAVEIPVIADADDGYGNALSTIRTVQEYVRSGVAGIHIEDQVFPKRCGHIAGKTIIPLEAAVGKYRAAIDTRNQLNPDFVIIARTDAYGAVGGSLEEAIRRGRAYADAGVDLVWPELSSPDREPAVAFAKAMRQSHPNLPLAFNYSSSFKWHKDPNPFTFRELGELGYKFIFITIFAAHAGMYAVWNAMEELVKDEEQAQWRLEKTKVGHPTESHHVMARVSHFQELEKRYIPGSDERIRGSAGYDDSRMH
jgi:isocitrate/methylisocitrate lyase